MTFEEIEKAILELVTAAMPRDACVIAEPDDDLIYTVSWPPRVGQVMANQQSRTIDLIFPYEIVHAILMMRDVEQVRSLATIRTDIVKRWQYFEADRDHPRHQSPLIDVWVFSLKSNWLN